MKVKNTVAVITGGASGLGAAGARALVGAGARVALWDLDEARGRTLAGELGTAAVFCPVNVADEASVQAAAEKTVEAFGAIDVAVNCAGIGSPAKVLTKKGPMPMAGFLRVLQVNLIGTMHVIRAAGEKMLANSPNDDGEKGVVINTASVAAFEGQIGQAAYSASKAAIVGLTLPVAREFAEYGIRVATIAPGLFDTPLLAALPEPARTALGQMVPFPKRLGRPDEFAALVLHVIENAMINGEVIRLDGALRMAAK